MYLRISLITLLTFAIGCTPSSTEPVASDSKASGIRDQLENPMESTSSSAVEEVVVEPGGWGTLKGRFVFDGTPPSSQKLIPTKDLTVCGKHDLFNESLIVNPENKGIQNVVIFMYTKKGNTTPIHESYAATANDKVTMDNEFCRFNNHITVMRTTQTLLVRNLDSVGHNTKIDTLSNRAINPILPANGSLEESFPKAERLPAAVSCSIHPWMNGFLLVKDHPYFAVTDENGEFEIANLPSGNWTFQVWQEKCRGVTQVDVGGDKVEWKRGRFDQAVTKGDTDLGDILVSAAQFE